MTYLMGGEGMLMIVTCLFIAGNEESEVSYFYCGYKFTLCIKYSNRFVYGLIYSSL